MNPTNKVMHLYISQVVTEAEFNLLQKIVIQNLYEFKSDKSRFYLKDLSADMGYKSPTMIYRLLHSLEEKQVITRQETTQRGIQVLGLHERHFGDITLN